MPFVFPLIKQAGGTVVRFQPFPRPAPPLSSRCLVRRVRRRHPASLLFLLKRMETQRAFFFFFSFSGRGRPKDSLDRPLWHRDFHERVLCLLPPPFFFLPRCFLHPIDAFRRVSRTCERHVRCFFPPSAQQDRSRPSPPFSYLRRGGRALLPLRFR